MKDRTLGYLCIITLLLGVLLFIGYLLFYTRAPQNFRTIEFSNISGLSFINIEDPVLFKGCQIGTVKEVINRDNKTYLTIKSRKPITIYNDYNITIGAQGIMGDRFLNIDPGIQSSKILSSNQTLTGELLPSPPDAISKMAQLIDAIKNMNSITETMLRGSVSSPSFVSSYKKTIGHVDSVVEAISSTSGNMARTVPDLLDTLNMIVLKGHQLKDSLSKSLPGLFNKTDTILISIGKLKIQMDTVLNNAELMINAYHKKDFSKLQDFITATQSSLCSLQAGIVELREKGLYLPVRLW